MKSVLWKVVELWREEATLRWSRREANIMKWQRSRVYTRLACILVFWSRLYFWSYSFLSINTTMMCCKRNGKTIKYNTFPKVCQHHKRDSLFLSIFFSKLPNWRFPFPSTIIDTVTVITRSVRYFIHASHTCHSEGMLANWSVMCDHVMMT